MALCDWQLSHLLMDLPWLGNITRIIEADLQLKHQQMSAGLVNLMIRREEQQLEERFGEEFRAYKKQVRCWL
jgi:protein-S-isoprenylcysteine O-methyltransferase Ste14